MTFQDHTRRRARPSFGLAATTAVAVLLVASGCAAPGASSVASPSAPAASAGTQPSEPAASTTADGGTLKVGMMTGLSGGFAPWGTQFQKSLDVCIEKINDGSLSTWSPIVAPTGGINAGGMNYKVEVVPYDTENDVAKAVAGINKLVLQDQVKYIIGPVGETEAFTAGAPVINENGVLNLQLSTLWQAQGEDWPLSINILTDMQDYYQAVYKWLVEERPEVKRISIITTDQPYGRIGALVAHKAARDTGAFEIVSEDFVPWDTTDYNAVVTGALAASPDLIDIGGAANPNAFTGILTAAFQQGFKGAAPADGGTPIKFMATSWNPDLVLQNVSAEYYEGVVQGYPTASWGADGPTDEAKWLYEEMIAKYGAEQASQWNTVSPGGYYACRVLLEGIEAADSVDPTAIATALTALETVETPMGPAGWTGETLSGVNHSLVFPERVLQVQGGENVVVAEYAAPFTWNYDWQGLPGAEQFTPNP